MRIRTLSSVAGLVAVAAVALVRLGELGHGREYGVADAARVITEALR